MIVLSRKKNESIVINNNIILTVVEIRGDKVRLGIVAPMEVPVHRQEVFDAIYGHSGPTPGVRYAPDRQSEPEVPLEQLLVELGGCGAEGPPEKFTAEGGIASRFYCATCATVVQGEIRPCPCCGAYLKWCVVCRTLIGQ